MSTNHKQVSYPFQKVAPVYTQKYSDPYAGYVTPRIENQDLQWLNILEKKMIDELWGIFIYRRSFIINLYPSLLSIVYNDLLNFCFPLSNFPFSSNILTFSPSLNGTDLYTCCLCTLSFNFNLIHLINLIFCH